LHRFRLGLEFVLSGHREVDGMVEHHAEMARTLGEQLGLQQPVLEALSAAYERWDGRGWPGRLAGDDIPIAARLAAVAEFAEVAYRVGGAAAVRSLARKRRGKHFDPSLADLVERDAEIVLAGLDSTGTWDVVIEAEPALEILLTGSQIDAA